MAPVPLRGRAEEHITSLAALQGGTKVKNNLFTRSSTPRNWGSSQLKEKIYLPPRLHSRVSDQFTVTNDESKQVAGVCLFIRVCVCLFSPLISLYPFWLIGYSEQKMSFGPTLTHDCVYYGRSPRDVKLEQYVQYVYMSMTTHEQAAVCLLSARLNMSRYRRLSIWDFISIVP